MKSDNSSTCSESDDEDYRESLEKHRVEVVKCLDLERQFMFSYLRSHSILDDEDCQLILNSGSSRQQKNAKFLDTLSTRGSEGFQHFVNALEFEHSYLYKLFTGKEPQQKGKIVCKKHLETYSKKRYEKEISKRASDSNIEFRLFDYDREYLADSLKNISEQYRTLTCLQSKSLQENRDLERQLLETSGQLQTALKYQEELEFELQIKENQEIEEVDQDQSLFRHCQQLAQENAEKSNNIIALQARLLAINEDTEKRNRVHEKNQEKNQLLMQKVKDLTIHYDFQRRESKRLSETVERTNSNIELNATNTRQLHAIKFELAKVKEERDEMSAKADEYLKSIATLNAKVSCLQEQKDTESEIRTELSEEFFKLRHRIKLLEIEGEQRKLSIEFYKDKTSRLTGESNVYKEQIDFLTNELQTSVFERNRLTSDRDNVTRYNSDLLKSRDEAVQNQVAITSKFETRYNEVSKQLDQAKQDLQDLILKQIGSDTTCDSQNKVDIFTRELENTRQNLAKQSLTISPWTGSGSIPVIKKNVNTEITINLNQERRKSNSGVLQKAFDSLKESNRRRSESGDISLKTTQLSHIYDSLKGNNIPFTALLGTSTSLPVAMEDDDKVKRRLGSKREKKTRSRSRKKSLGIVSAICPMISSPELARTQRVYSEKK